MLDKLFYGLFAALFPPAKPLLKDCSILIYNTPYSLDHDAVMMLESGGKEWRVALTVHRANDEPGFSTN